MKPVLKFKADIYAATAYQFFVALFMLWASRFFFAWYNNDLVGAPGVWETLRLSWHGLRFDISAAAYFNVVFIAMRLLPFKFVYRRLYQRVSMWIYWVCNAIMLAINIADIPYYRFTGARLRWSNILNITTDSEIGNIAAMYAISYWWAFLGVAVVIGILVWLSARVVVIESVQRRPFWLRCTAFLLLGGLPFLGMRGRAGAGVPLAIPDAAFAVRSAPEINVVLNSPFCILRSLNRSKANMETPVELLSAEELARVRTSVHEGAPVGSLARRNVMIIIIESGGAEWIDTLAVSGANPHRGLMPFLDSIAGRSLALVHTIACSRSSCGGATAILAGFPAFDPFYFMLSPYNKNVIDSPGRLLAERGWNTAFYYGCKHGSFNIDQTAFAAGYSRIIDREAYGNDADFDGMWGIFDYPMGEFVAKDLTALGEPFAAAWFTVSAHGPFTIPEGWDTSSYKHPETSPERGLEYTDESLRHFFELASSEPWFVNTTFIITGDHGNRDFKGSVYDNDYIRNHIPLLIYTPDGSIAPGRVDDRVISQHDISPTILSLIGYDAPFVSVGADALSDTYDGYGIARTDGGRYLVVGTEYTVYTSPDLTAVEEVFHTGVNPSMSSHAEDYDKDEVNRMLIFAQAFMQDYTARLNGDRLTIANE